MQRVESRVESDQVVGHAGPTPSLPIKFAGRRPATIEGHVNAVRKVLNVMRRDPTAPLDLRAMAAIALMSRYHFLRVFEEITGISPLRFLAALRIERAKRLLLDTSLPVTTVCFDVGYNSLGTFTRLFVEYVGTTPNSFRKLSATLGTRSLDSLIADYFLRKHVPRGRCTITGSVWGPKDFAGAVFLGLFTSAIPQRLPVDGTLLMPQGRFELVGPSMNQPCCLMAAGFPTGVDAVQCLMPSQADLFVASIPVACHAPRDQVPVGYDLILRRPKVFDPPILTALPVLLRA